MGFRIPFLTDFVNPEFSLQLAVAPPTLLERLADFSNGYGPSWLNHRWGRSLIVDVTMDRVIIEYMPPWWNRSDLKPNLIAEVSGSGESSEVTGRLVEPPLTRVFLYFFVGFLCFWLIMALAAWTKQTIELGEFPTTKNGIPLWMILTVPSAMVTVVLLFVWDANRRMKKRVTAFLMDIANI